MVTRLTFLTGMLLFGLGSLSLQAQNAIFLTEGRIEFERKVNVWPMLDDLSGYGIDTKKNVPQFSTSYSDLLFKNGRSLYKPGKEVPATADGGGMMGFATIADDNIVYTDLEKGTGVTQKKVFDETYLIADSLRKIRWKMTTETRTIAGFNCRRANAIILDSIYVVAFYTDEIIPSGGPESFTGLPGMILGIALPHQHITWFATKVQTVKVSDGELAPPVKGQKMDSEALKKFLLNKMKEWGGFGKVYMLSLLI